MKSVTRTMVLGDKGQEQKVVFTRLTLQDLFSVADELQAEKEQVARTLGAEEGLDKFEIMNLVLEVRNNPVTVQQISNSVKNPRGCCRVLTKSMLKTGIPIEKHPEIVVQIPTPDAIALATDLVLDIQESDLTDDQKKKAAEEEAKRNGPFTQAPMTSKASLPGSKAVDTATLGYYGKPANAPAVVEDKVNTVTPRNSAPEVTDPNDVKSAN